MRIAYGRNAAIRAATTLMISLVVAGCVTAGSVTAPPEATASPTSSEIPTPTASASVDNHTCFSVDVSPEYAQYTIASLTGYGMTFVSGRVTSIEPSIYNTSDGKQPRGFGVPHASDVQSYPMIYTPINVVVDRVMSGKVKPGTNRFLIDGGTIGCVKMEVDTAPFVTGGAEYVFVLTPARDADSHEMGDTQRVHLAWLVDSSGTVPTVDGTMSLDDLAAQVSAAVQSTP